MSGTWDVWDAAERADNLVVTRHPLPAATGGGAYCSGDPSLIIIDPELVEPLRTEVLLHEFVHHERGSRAWSVAREEQAVNDQVAVRLVNRGELVEHVRGRLALDLGVAADDVAERFGVSERVAQRALLLLYSDTGGQVV